jgi:D-beta-D-heptose 7-phosphate kinase/D-beta-D-heptose 1-phosphate adenosyltransferase
MFQAAAKIDPEVCIIVNTDEWLIRKKGFAFMPLAERKEIICGFRGISMVISAKDDDETVCESLRLLRRELDFPLIFGNGGDRKDDNVPEVALCNKLDIKLAWNVGGEKVQSSQDLIRKQTE